MYFLNQMDIKGMTMVLCGSAQSFYIVFIIFLRICFPSVLLLVCDMPSPVQSICHRLYISDFLACH